MDISVLILLVSRVQAYPWENAGNVLLCWTYGIFSRFAAVSWKHLQAVGNGIHVKDMYTRQLTQIPAP